MTLHMTHQCTGSSRPLRRPSVSAADMATAICVVLIGLLATITPWRSGVAAVPVVTSVAGEAPARSLRLIGEVLPARMIPLSFQIDGRIAERHHQAGEHVTAGTVLFRLDDRDLRQALTAAEAEVAAAENGLAVASAERERDAELLEQNFISRQALERSTLGVREARTRLDAARATLTQARNALEYATLVAPEEGLLLSLHGEAGQVVDGGEPLGLLGAGVRPDIEVLLPESRGTPASATVRLADGQEWPLRFRWQAGLADPMTRQWQTRYQIDADISPPFGELVEVILPGTAADPRALRVPLSAIDERSAGAMVWGVRDGVAITHPVRVVRIHGDVAIVHSPTLGIGDAVVSRGTHLLQPGMAVRVVTTAAATDQP
jgi:RND family efflux transporter MFP subunit